MKYYIMEVGKMFCYKCGTQLPETSGLCHKCGTKIVTAETVQQETDTLVPTIEPNAGNTVGSSSQAPITSVQTVVHTPASDTDFKAFVDNHVQSTTKFQSADDLLKNSKPWMFLLPCFGIPTVVGIFGGPVMMLILGGLFGYAATFIASGIIRLRYRSRHVGEFIGEVNIGELMQFLNVNLRLVSPAFHEWNYYKQSGLGLQSIIIVGIANAVGNALKEVTICGEYGSKKKNLTLITIRPHPAKPNLGEMQYLIGAERNGFMFDGRASGFLSHSCLIKTAPILQAAIEYYLKNYKTRGVDNNVL
jgi:hypothetical protein